MEVSIPTLKKAFMSLLHADLTTQWRNRKSVGISSLMVPGIMLFSFKELVDKIGGATVISISTGMGLMGIGLMGYSNSIARDRDKDVFQRLRVAPMPSGFIILSRFTVQLIMILLVVAITFLGGYYVDGIALSPMGYILGSIMALVGGAVYLSLGQAVVGLIKSAETINSAVRLIYIAFIMLGMFGESGSLGPEFANAIKYSPYGAVRYIIASGLSPEHWDKDANMALLVALGYTVVFTFVGIKWFKWSSR